MLCFFFISERQLSILSLVSFINWPLIVQFQKIYPFVDISFEIYFKLKKYLTVPGARESFQKIMKIY